MTKNEFMDYVKYLSELFDFKAPTNKEVLATWYSGFKNTHINIAKDMAQRYFKEETGRFKIAKLLEYKSAAMAGKTDYRVVDKCPICFNTGLVQVEKKIEGRLYEMCMRCTCANGQLLSENIRMVDKLLLDERQLDDNGVFRIIKEVI